MPLPTSGSITIAQIASEMGASLPLDITSTTVRNFVGKPTGNVVIPNDFYGKGAVNAYIVITASNEPVGGGLYRDRFVCSVSISGATVTSYSWTVTDYNGMLVGASGTTTSSTRTLTGPTYNPMNITDSGFFTATCYIKTSDGKNFTRAEGASYTFNSL